MATVADVAEVAQRSDEAGRRGGGWRRGLAYTLLTAWALLMFVPFAWTIITSLKDRPEALDIGLPAAPDLDAFAHVWSRVDPTLPQLFLNSLGLAAAISISNVILGAMAGYAFARLRFPGREVIFLIVLATLMIPDQLRLVPVYQIMNGLGFTKAGPTNYLSVFFILAISATSIFLLRQYFLSIPRELEEAARIDGAGHFQTYWKVILPLAGPALATVAILTFLGAWNGLFWPAVFFGPVREHWTLPFGIVQFQGVYQTNWPPLMAIVVVATVPIV